MKETTKLIRDRLAWDDRIDESQIEVYVNEGIATLKGCVSTYPEKILAEIETQMVPGIKSVINNIEIKFPETFEAPTEKDVEEAMFCLLDANSEIDSHDIKVSIEKGSVTLEGIVNSYWKSERIRSMASQISGVVSVINKIHVVPDEEISDEEIHNLIITSMENSVRIDAKKVNLEVNNGIVSLSGILSSLSEYNAVKDIVKFIKGIIDVEDNLKWILRYQTT